MKVLVVLVLAIFTGCQANLFYADAPKPQIQVLTDAFWDYVAKVTPTADTFQMIRKSQFGQDVSARLAEGSEIASSYAVSIQEQLPPTAQDLITKVTTAADVLKERLNQELSSVRGKLQPHTEWIKADIQQKIQQLKQELSSYADVETLKTTLGQKSEDLKTSLEESLKSLQAQLDPYTDEMKENIDQHLQDFKETVMPMTMKVQAEMSHRAEQVQQMAAPYVEKVMEKLDPYSQDLQAYLAALYQSFVNES